MKKNGFTLIEIVIVVITVAMLATFAIVQYVSMIERMRAEEGTRVLIALFAAQKEYRRDTGTYHKGNNASINADLDVTIPNTQHFTDIQTRHNTITLDEGETLSVTGCGTVEVLASATRTGKYTLYVTEMGDVICSRGADCVGICQKMGFPTTW